jgi:hypothetical protein
MKYTIKRTFTLRNKKFEIIRDSKTFCTATTIHSKEYKGQYNIKLSNPINKYTGDDICIVEPDSKQCRNYLIYLQNARTEKKNLFGQLSYQLCGYNNYLYTIIIGQKLYQIRSSDLKDRRLTIIDKFQRTNSSNIFDCLNTLFQINEPFSKLNKTYHVTINDQKHQYGYLAIVILLYLHEYKRSIV